MRNDLLTCLKELAGPHVAVGVSEVDSDDGLLAPEPESVAKAIPKRRAEFAAGRRAARMAMRNANMAEVAIPKGENRAPVWPPGVVGSVSHDGDFAIAAVAPLRSIRALGIDLAEAADFPEHLRNEILLTPAERAQTGLEARVSFSAKETVFKSFYPSVGRYFGFGAVEIAPDLSTGTFTVTVLEDLAPIPRGSSFSGRVGRTEAHLITLLNVPN